MEISMFDDSLVLSRAFKSRDAKSGDFNLDRFEAAGRNQIRTYKYGQQKLQRSSRLQLLGGGSGSSKQPEFSTSFHMSGPNRQGEAYDLCEDIVGSVNAGLSENILNRVHILSQIPMSSIENPLVLGQILLRCICSEGVHSNSDAKSYVARLLLAKAAKYYTLVSFSRYEGQASLFKETKMTMLRPVQEAINLVTKNQSKRQENSLLRELLIIQYSLLHFTDNEKWYSALGNHGLNFLQFVGSLGLLVVIGDFPDFTGVKQSITTAYTQIYANLKKNMLGRCLFLIYVSQDHDKIYEVLPYLQEMVASVKDWETLHTILDVIEIWSRKIGPPVKETLIHQIVAPLADFRKFKIHNNWRVREKAVETLIIMKDPVELVDEILQKRRQKEADNRVIKTLSNHELVIERLQVSHQNWPYTPIGQQRDLTPETNKKKPVYQIPRAPTHFTGRADEIEKIISMLEKGSAIISIIGIGGQGKTGLVAKVINILQERNILEMMYPDGLLHMDFYRQPLIDSAITNIVKTFEDVDSDKLSQAKNILGSKRLLIVLDGVETIHETPQTFTLSDLLDMIGLCSALITSRRVDDALGDLRIDLNSLETEESVALFHNLAGSRHESESVEKICNWLGGHVLALRLAARFIANTANINSYISWMEETPFAKGGLLNRDARHRQESIAFLIQKSIELLSDEAKNWLALLGTMAFAPFRQEHLGRQSLAALPELVNYSLLVVETDKYSITHALIHAYAAHQMHPHGFEDLIERYINLVEQGNDSTIEETLPHALKLQENASAFNCEAAISRMAHALNDYLSRRDLSQARLEVLKRGAQAAKKVGLIENLAIHLSNIADTLKLIGAPVMAIENYQAALVLFRRTNDKKQVAICLEKMGYTYRSLGDVRNSIAMYSEALNIARELGDKKFIGNCLGNLGNNYSNVGDLKAAIECYEEAVSISQEVGDRQGESNRLGNLGLAYIEIGNSRKSVEFYEKALRVSQEIDDKKNQASSLDGLGMIYSQMGEYSKAISYIEEALVISRKLNDKHNEGNHLGNLGNIHYDSGDTEKAIQCYEDALSISRDIQDRHGEGNHLGNLGIGYKKLGEFEKAVENYLFAVEIARELNDKRGEGIRLGNLGNLYYETGNLEKAKECYASCLEILRQVLPEGHSTIQLFEENYNLVK